MSAARFVTTNFYFAATIHVRKPEHLPKVALIDMWRKDSIDFPFSNSNDTDIQCRKIHPFHAQQRKRANKTPGG